jgi:Raf kinase inhibitor-like YbhB/YbcL family protein
VAYKRRGTFFSGMALSLVFLATAFCRGNERATTNEGRSNMALKISSPAFAEGQTIPTKHTCDGDDVSPPLRLDGVPPGAKTVALICDDPDAPGGTWVHWVLYNVPASVSELSEGIPTRDVIPIGAKQGMNDFGRIGYGGPCPPRGSSHHYFFRLYALDAELSLKARATKKDLTEVMRGHILAEGQLMGTYKRK